MANSQTPAQPQAAPAENKMNKTIGWCVIAGIMVVALAIFINWACARENARAEARAETSQAQAVAAVVYPVDKTVSMNADGWVTVMVRGNEHIDWHPVERNVWMDTKINNGDTQTQEPMDSSGWKPITAENIITTVSCRITPHTGSSTGTLWYELTKK